MSLCDVVYFCVFVVSLERTFCLCGQWGHWMCFSFCWDSCTFPAIDTCYVGLDMVIGFSS